MVYLCIVILFLEIKCNSRGSFFSCSDFPFGHTEYLLQLCCITTAGGTPDLLKVQVPAPPWRGIVDPRRDPHRESRPSTLLATLDPPRLSTDSKRSKIPFSVRFSRTGQVLYSTPLHSQLSYDVLYCTCTCTLPFAAPRFLRCFPKFQIIYTGTCTFVLRT